MDSRERDYDRERYRDRDDRPRQDYRESRDRWDVVQSAGVDILLQVQQGQEAGLQQREILNWPLLTVVKF